MIACSGEALIDMVPAGDMPDAFLARPGGCPYNTAIAASRLGARVTFLGRLGTDFLGSMLHDKLVANGVDVGFLTRCAQAATIAFVSRDKEGNARYAFYSEGAADRSFAREDLPARLPPETRFLMLGSISMVQEPIASTIETLAIREKDRLLISLDPNIRPSLISNRDAYLERFEHWVALSALVKMSADDLEWLYPGLSSKHVASRLHQLGATLVVITLGTDGAVAYNPSMTARVAGHKVQVVDTIGAGDTFHAALLAELDAERVATRGDLESMNADRLRLLLQFANAAAALNCTRTGAEPPDREETQQFLDREAGDAGTASRKAG
jgi:fructokinase